MKDARFSVNSVWEPGNFLYQARPTQFHYSYFGTELQYGYTSCKLVDYDNGELVKSDKLFDKIMLPVKYLNDTQKDVDKRYAFKMKLIIIPIIQKEENAMFQFNEEELSPTMKAIFAHFQKEGERKGIEKVALEMLKEGTSIDFIAKVTHLDKEEIEKLMWIKRKFRS